MKRNDANDASKKLRVRRRTKTVAINEAGLRIGQDHPRAGFTDAEIELMRKLHEEGVSFTAIADKFGSNRWYVARVCRYEVRAQTAARFKTVTIGED